jgi:CheY-like chemotaxis protein
MNSVAEAMTGWKNSEAAMRPLQEVFVVVNEFTGIGLPGLDGFEVARRIRRSRLTASVPLVALTGYGDQDL